MFNDVGDASNISSGSSVRNTEFELKLTVDSIFHKTDWSWYLSVLLKCRYATCMTCSKIHVRVHFPVVKVVYSTVCSPLFTLCYSCAPISLFYAQLAVCCFVSHSSFVLTRLSSSRPSRFPMWLIFIWHVYLTEDLTYWRISPGPQSIIQWDHRR